MSILVLIGMWFERFNIIVPGLAHDFYPYTWGIYVPTLTDSGIVIGSFAWFFLLFLGFIKVMPSLSIVEVKETIPHPVRDGHAHYGRHDVLGVFAHVDTPSGRSGGAARPRATTIAVYTPVPLHEIEDVLTATGPLSPVRLFTCSGP